MRERSACRLLPYARHLVKLAVCDVLEQLMENELRLEPLARSG